MDAEAKGYLKFFRSVLLHPVRRESDSVFAAFVKLLLCADRRTGACVSTIADVQSFLDHGSKATTYKCLKRLQALEIVRVYYGRSLRIEFVNWDKYQRAKEFQTVQKVNANSSKNELFSSKSERKEGGEEKANCSKNEPESSKSELNSSKSERISSKNELRHKEVRATEEVKKLRKENKQHIRSNGAGKNFSEREKINFQKWWDLYPRKQAKKPALRIWLKLKPDLNILLKALEWQKCSEAWVKEGGRFIPMPTTYLNQERWTDEPQIKSAGEKKGKNYDTEKKDYQHLLGGGTDGR